MTFNSTFPSNLAKISLNKDVMPRGKYVNHKGRSRHFTSPEKLQQQSEEDSQEQASGSSDDDGQKESGAVRKSTKTFQVKKQLAELHSSPAESNEDSDTEARDAKKGVASLIEIENPNRVTKKTTQKLSQLKIDDDDDSGTSINKPEQLSRRERELIEKQKARQRYEKLHAAGKTSEAKSDLARLALIRKQREEAAAKRQAEKKPSKVDLSKKPLSK